MSEIDIGELNPKPKGKGLIAWIEDHKFIAVLITLVLIWASLFVFLYLKADEITKDPCSICAEKQGKDVYCSTTGTIPLTRTYFENGSVYDNEQAIQNLVKKEFDKQYSSQKDFNFSGAFSVTK